MTLKAQQDGLRHTIKEFLSSSFPRNKWIYFAGYKVYVQRDIVKQRFWLKAVEVYSPGQGTFKDVILPILEETLRWADYRALIVENVQTDQFAGFFRKLGWPETTDGCTFTFTKQLK